MKLEIFFETAEKLLPYIEAKGLTENKRLTQDIKDLLSLKCSDFLFELKSRSSIKRLNINSFRAAANQAICLNCKYHLTDHKKNLASVCLKCINAGINPYDYKTQRAELTCQKRYGVDNPFQAEVFKDKIRKVCLDRYGDTSSVGRNSVLRPKINQFLKESGTRRWKKAKETSIRKYGVRHWNMSKTKMKEFQDMLEAKHGKGITNNVLIPKNKKIHADRMHQLKKEGFWKKIYLEKVVPAMQRNHGVDNIRQAVDFMKKKRLEATGYEFPLQDPKSRQNYQDTCRERFGVDHPMQNPEIFKKQVRNNRRMNFYETSYRRQTYCVIGSYELFFLRYLLTKFKPADIKTGFDLKPVKLLDVSRRYYPDFWIKSRNLYVEIKSVYTLLGHAKNDWKMWQLNKNKARQARAIGMKLIWVVPCPKTGVAVTLPSEWYELSLEELKRFIKVKTLSAKCIPLVRVGLFQSRLLHSID